MANMTFKANLLPNTDLGYSLGSEDQRWKINGYTLEDMYVKKAGDTMSGTLTIKKSEPTYILKNTSYGGEETNAHVTLTMTNTGHQGLWSSGYFDGTNYTTSGKWLIERQPNGEIIVNGNATTANKWKTARTLTIGSTGKSVDGSANVSWSHAEIGATVSNIWTAGTTAGPTIKTTVNGVDGTAVAIPSASASASGVITTGAQTLAGLKIFKNDNGAIMTSKVGVTRGTIPSADSYSGLYLLDSTGQYAHSGGGRIAIVEAYYGTNGTTGLQLCTYPNTAGSTATNYIGMYSTQDGTASYSVRDPTAFRAAIGTDSIYVKKSGDTMTGNLIISNTGNPTLNIKNTNMDTHAASLSAPEYGSIYFYDKNSSNNLNGWIETGQATNGNVYLQIGARRRNAANNGNVDNALTLRTQQNGTLSVEVSSPAAWRTALGLGARATDNTAYFPYHEVTSFNANSATSGIYSCKCSVTNAPVTNHGVLIDFHFVGIPFQIFMPDNINYMYKRWYTSGAWTAWQIMNAAWA